MPDDEGTLGESQTGTDSGPRLPVRFSRGAFAIAGRSLGVPEQEKSPAVMRDF